MKKPPSSIGTFALIGISVAVFVADYFTGQRILLWGAVSPGVWAGEWHRLLAPHFIHSGLSHIAFNMYALAIFGRLVESLLGTARFLIVYFAGGIIGFYASLLVHPDGLAVGASAAIFSLMGFTLHYRLRRLPRRWLGIDTSFAQILGLNLAIGFIVPNVDQFAHLGGLIGGAIAGSLVGLPQPSLGQPAHGRDGEGATDGSDGCGPELDEEAQESSPLPHQGEPPAGKLEPPAARGDAGGGGARPTILEAGALERVVALALIALLSWAALSPLSFARATGAPALIRFAEAHYGGYFAPFVAADVVVLWFSPERQGDADEWRPVRGGRVERWSDEPIALGVYWRWTRGGGRTTAGEYAVYWERLDPAGAWQLLDRDEGWVARVDPPEGLIYRRSLIVEERAGELDGTWRVRVEVDGRRQHEQEFEIASSTRR